MKRWRSVATITDLPLSPPPSSRSLPWLRVLLVAAVLAASVVGASAVRADEPRYEPSSRSGRDAVLDLAERHFPPALVGWAVRTAWCESRFDLGAYDSGYDRRYGYYEAIGPWQIAGMWRATAWELFGGPLESPEINAAMAVWIYELQGPGAWPVCGQ